MKAEIKVLILEDIPSDAELAEREVKAVLKKYNAVVTDTEQGFIKAIEMFEPDLIISDYMLPAFNGMKALQITRKEERFIPFIILTGSMNEETAVECLKAGADDYVIKEHIKRLGPVILNALDKKKYMQERIKAQQELIDSERKYRNLFENSSEFLFTLDLKGNFTDVNKTALSITGYTKAQLLKMNFKDYIAQSEHRKLFRTFYKIFKTGKPLHNLLIEAEMKDKSKRYFQINLNLYKKRNQVIGFQGSSIDITERKKAENETAKVARRLKISTESAGIGIWELDLKNDVLTWDKRMFELYGMDSGSFEGAYETWKQGVHPDDIEISDAEVQAAISGKKEFHTQFRVIWPDGQIRFIEAHAIVNRDPDGTPKSMIGVNWDITDRKEAEKELRESEDKYRTLMNSLPVGVFRSTLDGKILSANPAMLEIYGYDSFDDLSKVSATELYSDENPREMILADLKKEGYLLEYETLEKKKDGSLIWISSNYKLEYNDFDNTTYINGVVFDITERKQAEDQIKQNLKEKTALIREIYHRTKNNMAVIQALLSIEAGRSEDDFVKSTFSEINNKIQAMALVQKKLYKAQDLSNIYLKGYIEDLTQLIMQSYGVLAEKVEIKLDLHEIKISIDSAVPLGLVINELITNVFKHAFTNIQEGKILIRLFQDADKTINLELTDNGRGFPPNFDPRKDGSMGLIYVFSIVEYQLNGEISVKSGKGLKWHIKIKDNLHKERV